MVGRTLSKELLDDLPELSPQPVPSSPPVPPQFQARNRLPGKLGMIKVLKLRIILKLKVSDDLCPQCSPFLPVHVSLPPPSLSSRDSVWPFVLGFSSVFQIPHRSPMKPGHPRRPHLRPRHPHQRTRRCHRCHRRGLPDQQGRRQIYRRHPSSLRRQPPSSLPSWRQAQCRSPPSQLQVLLPRGGGG